MDTMPRSDINIDMVMSTSLFDCIPKNDVAELLDCLGAEVRNYSKGDVICQSDTTVTRLGILLSGISRTESTNILGDRSIISIIKPGQLVCDAFSSTKSRTILIDITAQTKCSIMFIDTSKIYHPCSDLKGYGNQLSENLIHVLAQKYVDLSCKVIHLSGRSTRRKLLSYLSEQFMLAGGRSFQIPMNQQELADYLFVERSGLSTEFNNLKKEGVLVQDSDKYILINPNAS
jgi:CRP-like cAMP-binding protein